MEEKYQEIKKIVKKELSCAAHSLDHIMRVYNLCLCLAKNESDINLDVLKAAALLHDIARVKEDRDKTGKIDHAVLGAQMAENILTNLNWPQNKIKQVKHCIVAHRFRSKTKPKTKEAKILFDADKLDILGAIGIARSFIIAGEFRQRIYKDIPIDRYIKNNLGSGKTDGKIKDISKHAPNLEFETKMKYVPEKLYTPLAKQLAKERLEFMRKFFKRLKKEIEGKI